MLERPVERPDLGHHQEAGIRRQKVGDGLDRGMRPVRSRKGVVDIDVAERGKLFGEVWIVFLLAVVVTKIFEQSDLTRLERIDATPSLVADAIVDEGHLGTGHELRHLVGNRPQRGVGHRAGFGAPQMRQHNHLSASGQQLLDCRQDALDACRVADDPILYRHVEIDADKHAFTLNVEPVDGANAGKVRFAPAVRIGGADKGRDINIVHINLLMTTAVSLIRLEKPHSLSYQDTTLQKVPSTT